MSGREPRAENPRPRTDWPSLMAFGFGVLRLSPRAFWSMTPRELDAAMRGISGDVGSANAAPAPSRNDLATLMQRFPDISSN